MPILIIDNVNNLSGAPLIAREVADALGAPICCIRGETRGRYTALCTGVNSGTAWAYFLGVLLLLLKPTFWRLWGRSETIICNTSLTFAFAALSTLFGKRVVCVLHESTKKNALYKIGIAVSKRAAHVIVTPSKAAYVDLGLSPEKWRVVGNCLPECYFQARQAESVTEDTYVLFVGGSFYKGGALFRELQRLVDVRGLSHLHLHEAGGEEFKTYAGDTSRLGPEIYRKYQFVLVLTDNRHWRETFGMVGCEAAACGVIPLFTDRFAYREIWAPFQEMLYVSTYDAGPVLDRLLSLMNAPENLSKLREDITLYARKVCDRGAFRDQWIVLAGHPSGR